MKTGFSQHIFEKSSYSKFHENPSNESRIIACGRMDMTKLRVAFRNFVNVPKNSDNSETPSSYSNRP